MENAKEKKCEERIDDHLKSRLEEFMPDLEDLDICREILEERGEDIPEDESELEDKAIEVFQDTVHEGILSISKVTTYNVLLSYGGPSDEFEFDYDEDGTLVACRYRFKDWFDGAVRAVDLDTADILAERFGIYHEK